jgi:hypothetical protein
LLAIITAALFGVPILRTPAAKRIDLPCRPPLPLLRWWDLERVSKEDMPATIHAVYEYDGEIIATRQELGQLLPNDSEPWVVWRGPGDRGLQISVSVPASVDPAEYQRWQAVVRDCEGREVEFVEVSATGPIAPSRLD